MNDPFSFILQWEPTKHGPDEIWQTSGSLRINIQNRSITRVDDDWSKSVHDTVRVSCYPLAIWFASSWWRLCWEPTPEKPDTDWYLSHEMHGAGHGFLWPPMRFESDGETMSIICTPSAENSNEPIRYLTRCRESIPLSAFTKAIESFIQTVLARLETVGIKNTQLHALWREITIEQGDVQATYYRKLEAFLGFDPDDAPEDAVKRLLHLSEDVGKAAVVEIATACANRDSSLMLEGIERSMRSEGIVGNISGIPNLAGVAAHESLTQPPWERGRTLARAVRAELNNTLDPINDKNLCDIFGLKVQDLTGDDAPMAGVPWSLAIRNAENNRISLLFCRRNLSGRRFEMARWLGDSFSASVHDRWLPATNTKTARQKMQRAFAAEFLVPIDALCAFLEGDFIDEERIEDAGKYFGVSPLMVKSHLSNHNLILPETVGIY